MSVARAAVVEHLAAFNAHDTERLLAGFAPDVVWITGQDTVVGADGLTGLFDAGLWALDPRLEVVGMLTQGDDVAAQLRECVTVDGERRTFPIAAFFTVADGLITRAKIYREGNADLD
ncbi:MAG: nuclear transport factor 2 family protein [Jatrophihabitans sp.]|uniref:nuclear transport factor 2 family protein n=1 Tax=Jatrophihabitans sp. TaxID=1932789 RepID=UPI003F80C783